MQVRELTVPGSWVFTPPVLPDSRGSFAAPFQTRVFTETVGRPFALAQVNVSRSRRGVLRGIHFADVPPGQAKYVSCVAGAVLDVVVDLRVDSPTFGVWDAVRLDDQTRAATYLPEGLGHAFLALSEHAVVTYLSTSAYDPAVEHGVDPLDPELGLPWEQYLPREELVLSDKDLAAPSLAHARTTGLLPTGRGTD